MSYLTERRQEIINDIALLSKQILDLVNQSKDAEQKDQPNTEACASALAENHTVILRLQSQLTTINTQLIISQGMEEVELNDLGIKISPMLTDLSEDEKAMCDAIYRNAIAQNSAINDKFLPAKNNWSHLPKGLSTATLKLVQHETRIIALEKNLSPNALHDDLIDTREQVQRQIMYLNIILFFRKAVNLVPGVHLDCTLLEKKIAVLGSFDDKLLVQQQNPHATVRSVHAELIQWKHSVHPGGNKTHYEVLSEHRDPSKKGKTSSRDIVDSVVRPGPTKAR